MNKEQLERIENGLGFIAALDQSGGSTPKALSAYGVEETSYQNEDLMYTLVHAMRTRIIKSPSFNKDRILGAILFKQTMRNEIEGKKTADFLWQKKGIVPFLKIDEGLWDEENGVQLMKPMPELLKLLEEARAHNIFGTKMRSVIKSYDETGIAKIVEQQFLVARQILTCDLMPIIEPEVDIHASDKEKIERFLQDTILAELDALDPGERVMLKLSIPTIPNFYEPLIRHKNVLRVVALSGGYSREDANRLLVQNPGLIASFSRALSENLNVHQTEEAFDALLGETVESIYQSSIA